MPELRRGLVVGHGGDLKQVQSLLRLAAQLSSERGPRRPGERGCGLRSHRQARGPRGPAVRRPRCHVARTGPT